MKTRLLAAVAALAFLLSAGQAMATCPSPLTGKDAAGTTQNFGVTVDASGNCYGNISIVDGTAAANKLGINSSGQAAIQAPPSLPLPTGAATSALQTTGNTTLSTINTTLSTINTTLGSPFQAGGSVGNTGFNALQGGSANAVGNPFYVTPGTGATWAATQSGTWNVTNISGTVSLPTGAATAANQSTEITDLGTIATAVQASIPAGSAIIGKVGIDQTTPGTTNAVQANIVSGGIASGAVASGAVASGAYAAGAFASGALASGSMAAGSMVDLLTMRGTVGAGTAPADALIGGAIYNSTPITVTNTQSAALQSDANGFLKVNVAANAFGTITVTATDLSTNVAQVNGVTVLTGTGATGTGAQRVTVATDQATNAGAALVKGGVGVVNGGSYYVTVAASQTAQVLQSSTGATGDYLSHCTVIPTTVSPGVFTILDNSTAIYSFPGGASSLSNLVPFAIPVGAVSASGAWKITTGAGLSAVCVGKFS